MILCGDCLQYLRELEDKTVDLLLTDPPFGLNGEEEIEGVVQRLQEADRVCKKMMILMDYRNLWRVDQAFHESKIGELVWEYGWVSGGRAKAKSGFFPTHNTIGLYGDKKDFRFVNGSIIRRQPGFSSPRQCSFAKKTGHPYEKPVPLMEYLIEGATKPGDTVMDCFMGTGTVGVAAKNTARQFIGMEIERKWYDVATERIEGD